MDEASNTIRQQHLSLPSLSPLLSQSIFQPKVCFLWQVNIKVKKYVFAMERDGIDQTQQTATLLLPCETVPNLWHQSEQPANIYSQNK